MEFSKNLTIFLNTFLTILTALIVTLFVINKLILEGIGVCIIGILVVIWLNIWQARNHPINVFPLLNITALEKWAIKFSDSCAYIKSIVLYPAPFSSSNIILSRPEKYILFFDFDTSTVKGQNSKGTFDGHTWFTKRSGQNYPIDDSFKEVYINPPIDEFSKEWMVKTEKPKGINKRLSKILYDNHPTHNKEINRT